MRAYLVRSYTAAYELHVRPPKGKRSSTLWTMSVSGQLLATHHENGILIGSDRASGNDLVVEDKLHRTRS